jgi:hypothetical protein
MHRIVLLWILLVALPGFADGQRAELQGIPAVTRPAYPAATGPRIAIDGAHHNFHTAKERYAPFAAVLDADGYRVSSWGQPFTRQALSVVDILVIANALSASMAADWAAPPGSAFSPEEIEALVGWVDDGGSLMLIADHMPFPAAAAELARAFGFFLYNGYVLNDDETGVRNMITFSAEDGSLLPHPVVSGGTGGKVLPSVTSFLGHGFLAPPDAQPIMQLQQSHNMYFPDRAGKIGAGTTSITVEQWLQGATLEFGEGRLAVFGEAAMFTAQVNARGDKVGLNHPRGLNNVSLLLNTLRWLHPSMVE